jgi:multicomponent Na+:H+ antiporter subunit E
MRRVRWAGFLAVVWILLWGSASAANVLSGVAVGLAVTLLFPPARMHTNHTVRPLWTLWLVLVFAWMFLKANVVLAYLVVRGAGYLEPGIVAVPLLPASDAVITLVANGVTLTPGTLSLEVKRGEHPVLYVHSVRLTDEAQVRDEVRRLQVLVMRAFAPRSMLPAAEVDR